LVGTADSAVFLTFRSRCSVLDEQRDTMHRHATTPAAECLFPLEQSEAAPPAIRHPEPACDSLPESHRPVKDLHHRQGCPDERFELPRPSRLKGCSTGCAYPATDYRQRCR